MKKVPLSGGATPSDSYLSSQDRRWREVRLYFHSVKAQYRAQVMTKYEELMKPEVLEH